MTEIETVEQFLRALESFDLDRALALVAPDVVYQNVPLAPARGVAAFERQLRGFARLADALEVELHHIAANGPIVLTERTDTLVMRGARAAFWVCGTFEVQAGKIVLWRDYFDWAQVVGRLLLAAPRALLGRLRG
ncbi:MAG: nuclear transport factor 2 family protein [Deltaproteobacteria bacterium]|nr:nuclear transport factor 2 family protein [Deltaproteobacteria bacterium]